MKRSQDDHLKQWSGHDKVNPISNLYLESTFLGRMFFSFAKPLLNHLLKCHKFDESQLLSISGSHISQTKETNQFMQTYRDYREIYNKDILMAMLLSLYHQNVKTFWMCLLSAMVAEMLAIYCCYQIGFLISFMQTLAKPSMSEVSFLIMFSLAFVTQIFLRNLHYFYNTTLSLKMKKLLMNTLYQKISRTSLDSMGEVEDGKLISLLQSYIFILEKILVLCYYCAVAPVAMLVSCALIAIKGGLIYAIAVQFLYIVLFWIQYLINLMIGKVIGKESLQNDKRIGLIYSMLLGLKTIKCFALEMFFLDKILALRQVQQRYQRIQTALSSLGWALLNNSGYVIALSLFMISWKLNYYLDVSFSFSTLTILAYLSSAILSLSLGGMTGIQQFLYLLRRIGVIMELPEQKTFRVPRLLHEPKSNVGIKAFDCSFSWNFLEPKSDQETPKLALQNVNFTLKSGELLVVIGYVGSGKTTLLKSILNETKLVKGNLEIKGSIAYVEQEPFIFPGTVKENILFGKTFNQEKFDQVVRLCELDSDFKQMSDGENTVMGEAGCNVSGGQKARLSLARALYEDADIYLLDNPMSALDSRISQKIIENVVKGFLKNKCTVLVTFQPKLIPNIDKLLVLDQCHQIRIGSPDEIYQEYGYLNDIIQNEPSEMNTDVMATPDDEEEEFNLSLDEKSETASLLSRVEKMSVKGELLPLPQHKGTGEAASKIFSKYSLGPFGLLLYVILSALPPMLLILAIYWLGFWAANPYYLYQNYYANRFMMSVGMALACTITRNIFSYFLILKGANKIHHLMCERVLRAQVSYFDANPIGKLITRFAKDQFLVDQKLNFFVLIFSEALFGALGSLIYAIVITPYASIPVLILICISIYIYRKCQTALGILQNYENTSRDPLQSNFLTMISGIITCRAYGNVGFFGNAFEKQLAKSVNASFSYVSIIRWQGLRVQLVGGAFTLTIAWLAVLLKEKVNSSLLSVLMVFVMDIAAYILVAILFYAEYQYCMPSVERMLQLTEIDIEDDLVKPNDAALKDWPSQGKIKFHNMTMKYREDLEPAVNGVTFEIEPGMKVGIVGRTGAGKSSILQSLFRLIELSDGHVEIDGVDIKTVGLHTLRKNIGYIPQTPFLFSGTVSENLDPFDQRTDEQMKDVLKKTYLWDYVSTLDQHLEHFIVNPNLTFSQGGKQLMCLARELLRNCKIMVLDEATANIDYYTDQLIQKTLRENCKNQTMLTIAHRISTVIDSDRILVLDQGRVIEYDHPFKLLTQKDSDTEITSEGFFALMIKAYSEEEQKWLFNAAKNQYFKIPESTEFDTITEQTE